MKALRILFFFLILLTTLSPMADESEIAMMLPPVVKNGALVGTIVASDPDPGQTLSYTIITGNVSSSFKLEATTGKLFIRNAAFIKSTSKKSFALLVKVTDNGKPPLSAQATVTVYKKQ